MVRARRHGCLTSLGMRLRPLPEGLEILGIEVPEAEDLADPNDIEEIPAPKSPVEH